MAPDLRELHDEHEVGSGDASQPLMHSQGGNKPNAGQVRTDAEYRQVRRKPLRNVSENQIPQEPPEDAVPPNIDSKNQSLQPQAPSEEHRDYETSQGSGNVVEARNTSNSTSYQDSVQSPKDAKPAQIEYKTVGHQDDDTGNHSQDAVPIKHKSSITTLGVLSFILFILVSVAFIVLACMALSVDGTEKSQRGETVLQAARLGPTIFPVLFAAIVGGLMRSLALWRAERGSRLGLLEQLNGSQNLLAAIERAVVISGLWGWGALVVLIWALSPLGGQSSLRVLEVQDVYTNFDLLTYYFNTDTATADSKSAFFGLSSIYASLPVLQGIYTASLLAPSSVSSSAVDTWSNVKIPLIQAQTAYTGDRLQDWIEIEHNNRTVYSSLTGIVIPGLQDGRTANFTLETSYMNLTCPEPMIFNNVSLQNASSPWRSWMGDLYVGGIYPVNFTRDNFSTSFHINTNTKLRSNASLNTSPMNLLFVSFEAVTSQLAAFNCSLGATRVESVVGCNGTQCKVEKMRPSRFYTESSIITPLHKASTVASNFISQFPFLSTNRAGLILSPPDLYVAGNDIPFRTPVAYTMGNAYTNISSVKVAQRLGSLLNTVWQSAITKDYLAISPPASLFNNTTPAYLLPFDARNVTAAIQTARTEYHANKVWIGLTITISLLLLAFSIAGLVLSYITKAPDILGYVSTMTRDNPYFHDDRDVDGDRWDGLRRAGLLRDVVVQVTDVGRGHGRSHIALRSVATGQDYKSGRLTAPRKSAK